MFQSSNSPRQHAKITAAIQSDDFVMLRIAPLV